MIDFLLFFISILISSSFLCFSSKHKTKLARKQPDHCNTNNIHVVENNYRLINSIEEQVQLFNNIKALFAYKQLILVANKVDIKRIEELSEDKKKFFDEFRAQDIPIIEMSTKMFYSIINKLNL